MLNESTVIYGNRLVLVPYLPHHVEKYHKWMCDPDILRDTCSEPQTLAEEVENQQEWIKATDKLTFIILAPAELAAASATLPPTSEEAIIGRKYVPVGDCNLFKILNADEGEMEVNVMVAEGAFRGKGVAREAVSIIMSYAIDQLNQRVFVAKILTTNDSSKALFEQSKVLAFTLWKEVKVFDEAHYLRRFEEESAAVSFKRACGYRLATYTREMERALCGGEEQ